MRTGTHRVCSKLLIFLGACLLAAPLLADQGDAPGRAARLSYVKGSVSLQASGENQWSQPSLNYTITTGDRLYTDQGSRAELEVGPYAVRMSQTTDLTMANLNDQLMQLGLAQGTIRLSVYQLSSGNTVEIDTPNGALTILRPGSYRVDSDPNNGYTLVSVNSGALQVTGGGANQTIGSGQAAQLTGTGPIQIASASLPAPDDFDQWSMNRDRRIESSASARYASRYMPGYEDLGDYGQWRSAGSYGEAWYPSGVPPDWVPYRYGSWGWVEPWGWTWVENEPWGFCPFHYGRWAFIGGAWGWVPGPVGVMPLYSPALVAFVGGSGFSLGFSFGSAGVAAWFPLGPGEPFIPWYHYSSGYLRQVNITNVRNVTNITNITNITNVSSINYVNRTVATTAVPAAVLRTGQPVAHQAVHVSPQQIAKAQVVAHPSVTPAPQVARGGKPTAPPQIRPPRIPAAPQMVRKQSPPSAAGKPSQPPPLVSKNTPPERQPSEARPAPPSSSAGRPSSQPPPLVTKNTPPERQPSEARPAPPSSSAGRPSSQPPPLVSKNTPPERQPSAARPAPPPPQATAKNAPQARSVPPPTAPTARSPLITKSAPPPPNVPFEKQQPAMQEHPGRPLEPQQKENLRAGKPAGPMHDREVAPHPAAPTQARSAPPPAKPSGEPKAVPGQKPKENPKQ
jgi:hypothetical protein